MAQQWIFYILAGLTAFCSVMVVTHRNPIAAAIFLVMDMFLIAGLYALLEAHFVAAIQVLVYAGAIMVLFLFVIMLLDLKDDDLRPRKLSLGEIATLAVTTLGFIAVAGLLAKGYNGGEMGIYTPEAIEAAGGNTFVVGMVLFSKYLWPFELASILILLAIVASVVIAKKDKKPPRKMPRKKVSPRSATDGAN